MTVLEFLARHPVTEACLGAVALAVIGWMIWRARRHRPDAEELERRRRLQVSQQGRTIEGVVTEIEDAHIHYVYSVRGMHYTATQEIGALGGRLPADAHRAIGTV